MAEVSLKIDDKEVVAEEGTTVLEAARSVGIDDIPTLCYHEALEPYGACRLCTVEIISKGRSRLVTSCTYLVEEGLEVKTRNDMVINGRKMLIELLLARCPEAKVIQDLAKEYGVEKTRFKVEKPEELCILCGLCARFCEEVVGASAITFTKRGTEREVTVLPEITPDLCIGCGACAMVCPTGLITCEDLYGRKIVHSELPLGPNTAISVPIMQAVPNVPVIDPDHCIHFKTGKCKLCERFCEREAINYEMEDEYIEIEVGNIIVATGFQPFDPSALRQYGYGELDNVITSLEFERLVNAAGPTEGRIVLKDGSEPKTIGIIHCVGSRDKNCHEYCSQVCCMYSMKFGHLVREHVPGAKVYEFYIDLRAVGKAFEEFYNRVLDEGTVFVRGRPSDVIAENGRLILQVEDTLADCERRVPVDMVILSIALEPRSDAEEVARLFSLSRSADGFFLEKHPKLDPVATMSDGIFVAGCCQSPKDIPQSVVQASAAAARALAMISLGKIEIEAATSVIDETKCAGCKTCLELCPYNAISFDEEKNVSLINEALCKGCGTCASACPSGAITARHFNDEQIMAEIEGVLI
ncbi:Ferredoxin-type protein NapF [subsurface metagenome]